MDAPAGTLFPPVYTGLAWHTLTLDRTQQASGAFNLALAARGGSPVAAVYGAKQGAGAESSVVFDGVNCNVHGGSSYRILRYWMPVRQLSVNVPSGTVFPSEDQWTLDALIGTQGGGPTQACGLFLVQSDGTDVPGLITAPGQRGFGFSLLGASIQAFSAQGGPLGPAILTSTHLHHVRIALVNARNGSDAFVTLSCDGIPLAATTLFAWQVSTGISGYAAGRFAFVPQLAGDGADLLVGGLTISSGSASML